MLSPEHHVEHFGCVAGPLTPSAAPRGSRLCPSLWQHVEICTCPNGQYGSIRVSCEPSLSDFRVLSPSCLSCISITPQDGSQQRPNYVSGKSVLKGWETCVTFWTVFYQKKKKKRSNFNKCWCFKG